MISFLVPGVPQPQGSKVANPHGHGVRDANAAKLKPWRTLVAVHAHNEMLRLGLDPTDAPVRLDVLFTFTRPLAHLRRGQVRPEAPRWHTNVPDADKLARAICDALTGIVWHDDRQVADLRASKVYGPRAGACIEVVAL